MDLHENPSLNTQSRIKGLLGVQDFCFWAIWAARPILKKRVGSQFWATFMDSFFMFSGSKFSFLNIFLGLQRFSNLNVLHKGLLMQDWVFRLGLYQKSSKNYQPVSEFLVGKSWMNLMNPQNSCKYGPVSKNSSLPEFWRNLIQNCCKEFCYASMLNNHGHQIIFP